MNNVKRALPNVGTFLAIIATQYTAIHIPIGGSLKYMRTAHNNKMERKRKKKKEREKKYIAG